MHLHRAPIPTLVDALIRTGIVGTGWIAHEHVLALKSFPDVEIVVVSSASLERAKAFAASHGIANAVAPHVQAIAAADPDVVHVCSTNAGHYDICVSAVERGKHIVCEKPLAVSTAQTLALLELTRKGSRIYACNYNYRAYPMVQQARDLVHSGEIGEVHLINGTYAQDWLLFPNDHNWRLDPEQSGISATMGDIGTHWLDLAEHVSGLRFTEIFARLHTAVPMRLTQPEGKQERMHLDDSAVLSLTLDNGAVASVIVSQVSAGHKNQLNLEIVGSLATVSWSQENPDQLWIGHRGRANEVLLRDSTMALEDPLPAGHPFGWRDSLRRNLDSIYKQIKDATARAPVSYATFADGHRGLELLEAVVLSASRHASISTRPAVNAAPPSEGDAQG
jgi:predicted dehydrogenase